MSLGVIAGTGPGLVLTPVASDAADASPGVSASHVAVAT